MPSIDAVEQGVDHHPNPAEIPAEAEGTEVAPQKEWNEDLDPELQQCLIRLAQGFGDEFRYPRRLEVMADWRARMFWREVQHLNWNWENETWEALGPAGTRSGTQGEKYDSAVLYSTNIFQGFGDSYIAIMTQQIPQLRFEPEDPEEAADIETAAAADSIRKIIQHDNDPIRLMVRTAYLSWTAGRIHGWTCAMKDKRTGQMREHQFVEGVMEVKVPILADGQDDFLYLRYSKEYHIATVRSMVKDRAFEDQDYWKKIKGGQAGQGQDAYERTARISAKQGISMRSAGGDAYASLCTIDRTWMRSPDAFYAEEVTEEQRDQLIEKFPGGVCLETANGTYIGSKDEKMDDCWAVEQIMEGDGQFRNSKGTCLISVQERANDIINATQDVYEKTLPASHWDQEVFSVDAMRKQRAMPGARYGVDLKKLAAGDTIAAHVFFEPSATVSADMLTYLKELMVEIPQFLTGISAILFGQDQSGDKSGKALSIQQNMAMGRIGLPWGVAKRFYSRMMDQAVRLAAKTGGDRRIGVPDESGKIETIAVREGQLSGKVRCFPVADQNFPESWTAKRATYMQLLQEGNTDPIMRQILSSPRNQQLAKKLIGLEELEIPGADSWNKQMKEIAQLLAEVPSQADLPSTVPNPVTGEPEQIMQQKLIPSLGIDATWDDNEAEFLTVKIWVNRPEGQRAAKENPDGFKNVKLHGELHRNALMGQMQAPGAPAPKPAAPMPQAA
jgi:hypothetical protein